MKTMMKASLLGLGLGLSFMGQADACGIGVQPFETTANLNLRSGAGTQNTVLTTIPKGTKVVPTEKDGSWVKVKYNNKEGWCTQDYLKSIDTCTIPKEEEVVAGETFVKIFETTANLNLRQTSDPNSPIMTTFKKGTRLHSTNKVGNMYYVEDGHIDGWVSEKYIKEVQLETEETTETPEQDETYFIGKVNVGNSVLNLRKDRSTTSRVIAKLPNGHKVEIKYETGEWLRVETMLDGKKLIGYVASKFII